MGTHGWELRCAEAELIARDSSIALLDHVLDPQRALNLLGRRCPPLAAEGSCVVRYLRYKPGVSLVAGVALGRAQTAAMLMAVSDAATSKIAKIVHCAGGPAWNRHTQVVVDTRGRLLLATARHDRDLPGVAAVLDRRGPVGSQLGSGDTTVLRYLPARRWLAMARAAGRTCAVRVLPVTPAHHASASLGYLRNRGLPVPDVTAHDLTSGIIATAWVPGTCLSAASPTADQQARLGRVLADLHGQPPGPLPTGPDHAADLRAAVGAVTAVLPSQAEKVFSTATDIIRALPTAGPRVVCHGDLSSDQVIVRPDGSLALIDLDRACLDHPGIDFGSWAATQLLSRPSPDLAVDDVLAPVLAGYPAATRLSRHDLRVFTAAAVLRRSVEPFRHRDPDWPGLVAARVALAQRVLGGRSNGEE